MCHLKLVLLISTFSIFCFEASADFTGQWEGKGLGSSSTGWSAPCENIRFTINQRPTELEIVSGYVSCGTLEQTWDPSVVQIRGDELIYEDKIIGKIGDDFIKVDYDTGKGYSVLLDIKRTDNSLSFKERIEGSTGFLLIEGDLEKK